MTQGQLTRDLAYWAGSLGGITGDQWGSLVALRVGKPWDHWGSLGITGDHWGSLVTLRVGKPMGSLGITRDHWGSLGITGNFDGGEAFGNSFLQR